MKKQTAVEWLYELSKTRELDKFDLELAKEIEKKQIIEFAWNCQEMFKNQIEERYNKTYGK